MAPGEGGEGAKAALPLEGDEGGPLAGLWPALLVALVAAVVAWLWYGGDKKEAAAAAAAASAPAGSPQPPRREEARGEEPFQGSYGHLASEAKSNDLSVCREPARNLLVSPGEHSIPRETAETESIVKDPATPFMNCTEYPNEIFDFPATASEPPKREETEMCGGGTSAEAGASSNKPEEKCREQQQHHSLDHEEWEVVSEHLTWGDATRNISVEDASGSKDLEQAKRVAAVSPMPQTVHVTFRVHYITYSETQLIAVTGDHECLGQWHHYVPLRCDKDGFWSDSVILPVDTRTEWKFIVVENGKVRRWEECDNRTLVTEHEDRLVHKWWGYH